MKLCAYLNMKFYFCTFFYNLYLVNFVLRLRKTFTKVHFYGQKFFPYNILNFYDFTIISDSNSTFSLIVLSARKH